LCSEVLEHLPQPVLAIKEFSRLLKKGGYLILTAPFSSLTHYSPYYFYSGFSRNFYETFLGQEGFEIIEISPNGNFFEYLAQEIMRLPDVSLRYCGKRIGTMGLILIKIFLRILRKLSSADTASSELLCFGWHILAKKKD
jgi:SAM-dependent methyltransferase